MAIILTKLQNYTKCAILMLTLSLCVSCAANDPVKNSLTGHEPVAPKYNAKELNDEWRSVYGEIPGKAPRDNDSDFYYQQRQGTYPPTFYPQSQQFGQPTYQKGQGKTSYPTYNNGDDNSLYSPQQPRPQSGKAEPQQPQPNNSGSRDNDSEYFYPLFHDSGG